MDSLDYKKLIDDIWFERRDIVSDGYDRALERICEELPGMDIRKYKSGSEAWTWIIPDKWTVHEAHIKAGDEVLLDLKDHPLHVMSYSQPVSKIVKKEELIQHIYARAEYPDEIPFEFSYFEKKWGFCIQHNKLVNFIYDEYDVLINSSFEKGELKVGSLLIPGESDNEIVIMAHLCHPCMVDDGVSGVAVGTGLIKKLMEQQWNHYSYRFLLFPETIGSLAFLSGNEDLLGKMKYGIFLEMLGHKDILSLQKSRQGNTLIDRATQMVLKERGFPFRTGEYKEVICNDELNFNGPGVNIPTVSLSRSKFWGRGEWPYPQYHLSSDSPDIVTVERLEEAESVLFDVIVMMESNYNPVAKVKGPIFLSRYDLWVDWRENRNLNLKQDEVFHYLHDPEKTLIDIAFELDISFALLKGWLDSFEKNGLIEKMNLWQNDHE